MLNTLARWIVRSSTNPSQESLTIKGILVATIPTIMFLLNVTHLGAGQDMAVWQATLTSLFDTVATLIQLGLTLIAALMTGYGLLRKLLNTITLHQEVVQAMQVTPVAQSDTPQSSL